MADVDTVLPWIKPEWVGVEIGVKEGYSALRLLEYGCRFMYFVDPWEKYEGYTESAGSTDGYWEREFRLFQARVADYSRRFAVLRMPSAEAVNYIPMVDFVWIDGNHRYEWVKSDLEYYWPKIRIHGVLCGHDYTNNDTTCQVQQAVDEFAAKRGLTVEKLLPCWLMRKV